MCVCEPRKHNHKSLAPWLVGKAKITIEGGKVDALFDTYAFFDVDNFINFDTGCHNNFLLTRFFISSIAFL